MKLNLNAHRLCQQMCDAAESLRVVVHERLGQARIIDCGVAAPGGLEAGRRMAEICLAGLGQVEWTQAPAELGGGPAVRVATDQPVAACMAAQYAGWKIEGKGFFAMGSGPMRAAGSPETLFDTIGCREKATVAVGVLECRVLPPADVCRDIANRCGVDTEQLTLLVAPTASQAGTVQIVARALETALHKLNELGFDLSRVVSGVGLAPLPPVAADDLTAIGRTNDAILYGGQVTLWMRGDDASLEQVGAQLPSCGSRDYGRPFAELFKSYGGDFYQIDPLLFSPAMVTLCNLDTGRQMRYGRLAADLIRY